MTNGFSQNNGSPIDSGQMEQQNQQQAYEEILAEIEKQKTHKKSWVSNLLILAFSLLIFFQLGLFSFGLNGLIIIIIVLLIHETGHLLGMRLFGYRNVQMFFIPFFGAAVSGQKRDVAAYKEAVVSLLGPMPGILIGCIFMFMFAATGRELYSTLASMFLLINVFNLLPFYPLDGGRFLYTVLFSRNRYLELCFRIFAALALILVGFALQAWLLLLLGLINIWSVKTPFKLSKMAMEIKQSGKYRDLADTAAIEGKKTDSQAIPPDIGKVIIDKVFEYFPPPLDIRAVASHTREIWEKISFRPSGIFSTATLLIAYLFILCLPLIAFAGSSIVSIVERKGFVESEIVEYEKPNGSKGLKEQFYLSGDVYSEIELDPESYLYHGTDVRYQLADPNKISSEGIWSQGKLHGEWKHYEQGQVTQVTLYDKGKFISRKKKVDGQWVEQDWQDLHFIYKWKIRRYQNRPQGPTLKQN
jgi:Zn-dependent protease